MAVLFLGKGGRVRELGSGLGSASQQGPSALLDRTRIAPGPCSHHSGFFEGF